MARLEAATASDLGRARVRQTRPTSDTIEARARLAATSEAKRFGASGKQAPFGGIRDIAIWLQNASVGAVLDPPALLQIAHFAAGARRLREIILSSQRLDFPILHALATRITPRPELEKAVLDAIDEGTREVKDDASLDLLRARRNIRQTQSNIQSRLRQMLSDPNVQPLLQDAFVTIRDGRYCLPVKAESRARVPGIVHDRSGSGGAFFVEPQAVVEMNNRLRELAGEEREAVLAVLSDLSSRVAGAVEDLSPSQEASGELDFHFAKAQLSFGMDALEPLLLESDASPGYVLLQARHPLVENCIPNDILLGDAAGSSMSTHATATSEKKRDETERDGFDVILITGPNTGGKTVVLKTLGLLSLMAGCGLHLPVAPGSRLKLPAQVFADIGDEQSIEQSLSTFSSHVRQIIAILKNARAGDLVLLDEVGAGTDPDEGAALAKAVLRTLQRRGVQVVATTHYGELKQFALGAGRFENASVEFDVKTLRPTYRLRIGVPGASNALDIAARLGMPPELVQRARRYLGRDRQEAEIATLRLEETNRELTEQTQEAQRERDEVERLKHEYSSKLARLTETLELERARARREAEATVRQAQEEADRILRDLRQAARESKQTEEARAQLRTLRENVRTTSPGAGRSGAIASNPSGANGQSSTPGAASAASAASTSSATPPVVGGLFGAVEEDNAKSGALASAGTGLRGRLASPRTAKKEAAFPAVGDLVRVRGLEKDGVLLSLPDASGRVDVRVGAVKVQVKADSVEAAPVSNAPAGGASIRIRKSVNLPDEINLIGTNTEDALDQLEKYLDDAVLAETKQVRIVHGKGTGALRKAIHGFLKHHRAVREFALAPSNEGGEGATVATFG